VINFVYVIGPPDSRSPVKIGTTRQIHERLRTFQMGSPVRLAVLWAVPGDRTLEAWLHSMFADRREHGEWFDLGPDPVEMIQEALGPYMINVTTTQIGELPLMVSGADLEGEDEELEIEMVRPVLDLSPNLSALARSLRADGLDQEEVRARLVEEYGQTLERDTIRKATYRAFKD
jgi:Meiotically Up-regulated Gene 113 (MUG113) protein